MPHHLSLAAAALILAATHAVAQTPKFAGYVINQGDSTVQGVMLVNGYSQAEIMGFVREDCASGKLGALQYVGNPYKKRGHTFQKFQITCAGGPSPRIGQTSSVSVEVELMPDGRNMTEYTYGVSGDVMYARYIR